MRRRRLAELGAQMPRLPPRGPMRLLRQRRLQEAHSLQDVETLQAPRLLLEVVETLPQAAVNAAAARLQPRVASQSRPLET